MSPKTTKTSYNRPKPLYHTEPVRRHKHAASTRILIIEDDPDTVAILNMFFRKEGYNVDVAGDGEQGLEKLREHHHDLVLSDVMMPKMDGFKFCELVRSEPDLKMTPIVLVTAKSDPMDKIAGLEKGADDYLVKPYNLVELRVRVASMLKLKKLRSELIQKEKELERILTLEQTLVAISHHINNATAPIAGRAQICDPKDPDSVKKLIEASIDGCQKITETLDLLAQIIKMMKHAPDEGNFSGLTVNDILAKLKK